MKSRSHRLPTHDDWVEESWTVDCVCGVNFDDGEEMVNCDECGVWVHTRCSRYVKGDKSFACDKCKNKNNRNDSEETEVAQLLVELPTKTLRMDNPSSYKPSTLPPARRPFRLWTEIPIEERVHVQGIPGGDPGLFSGLSSVFGPELWKSTGYVPKKFDFHYREFPCWDEDEVEEKELGKNTGGKSQNGAHNGTGDLFSLSKENILSAPAADVVGVKSLAEDAKVDGLKTFKQMNNLEGENSDASKPQNVLKPNDRSLLQPSIMQPGKRKKEDLGMLNDKSGKKKARIIEKEEDMKKNALLSPGTDRGPKAVKSDPQSGKGGNSSDPFPAGKLSHGPATADHEIDDPKCNLASSKNNFEKSSLDASGHYVTSRVAQKENNGGLKVPPKLEDSSKTIDHTASLLHHSSGAVLVKGEAVSVSDGFDSSEVGVGLSSSVGTDLKKFGPIAEVLAAAHPETMNDQIDADSETMMANDLEVIAKAKTQIDDNSGVLSVQPSPVNDTKTDVKANSLKYQEILNNFSSENLKVNGAAITISEASNNAEDVGRNFKGVNVRKDGSEDESPVDHVRHEQDSGNLEDSGGTKKNSSVFGPKSADEPSKSNGTNVSSAVALGECKPSVPGGNSSSSSPAVLMSISSACESHMPASVQCRDADTKQAEISESNPGNNEVNGSALTEIAKDEDTNTKKSMKEHARSSLSYVSKSSQAKKILHATVSKRTLADSKEPLHHSTSKPSPMANVTATPCSEPVKVVQTESSSNLEKKASALQTENASNAQKKVTGSILLQKGEKTNHSAYQSSSKVNITPTHAASSSNSPATLSDEELALLLHQELNSSPRVPRVSRMRHTGSLPQLTSPTATSMLMKRTCSTGGKENSLTSRRKTKDLAKDGLHGSREVDDETKKMDGAPSSSDQGRQDSGFGPDSVSKREGDSGSVKGVHFMKKSNVSASSSVSSPSEANEHLSSIRHSPRNPSDDDKGVIGRPAYRTLPGLIAEIMSKGKRMTYVELCNAVLPHWPNLRKHNGERYAYSSHSQAVLDCLRNRNEWARLVDRGPKTSGGRKRRKLDADVPGTDSEDNGDSKDRSGKDIRNKSIDTHHEEFPKGKRKARKRRRLALQERGTKEIRRRRRMEELSDDDIGSFSNSSEETVLSDESEGGGMSAAGNEVSASSDGTENS